MNLWSVSFVHFFFYQYILGTTVWNTHTHTPCRVFLQFWSSKAKSVCKQSVHILYCLPEVLSSTTTTWDFWLRFSTVKASNWTILPKATLDHGGWSCLMSRVKRSGCWSSCDLEGGRYIAYVVVSTCKQSFWLSGKRQRHWSFTT